jgi:hypothetical protein
MKHVELPAKYGRRIRPSAKDLKFASENQQLAGFSGKIGKTATMHEVDKDAIAASAVRMGAQVPSPQNRVPKPPISRFGLT